MKTKYVYVGDPACIEPDGFCVKHYRVDDRIVDEVKDCLNDLFEMGVGLVEKLGVIEVSENLNCVWGYYHASAYSNKDNYIRLSARLLADRSALRNTLMHELLHAARGCEHEHHSGQWKRIAEYTNKKYPNKYHISRCSNYDSCPQIEQSYKYTIYCPNCGTEWHRKTLTTTVRHPEWYRCGKCGTALARK